MNDSVSAPLPARDIVLIGAGHTHLHVVRQWRMRPIPDVRLTIVSPFSRAAYSGMLPGTLAGLYRPEEMEIDLWRLCESSGVRLIVDEAVALEPANRRVLLGDRPPIRYDVVSIGAGSVPGQAELWTADAGVLSVKPMATFQSRFEERLSLAIKAHGGQRGCPVRVAVVGAGAGGTEVVFGIQSQLEARGVPAVVALIDGGAEVLRGYSSQTIRRARKELARRGIQLHLGKRVADLQDSSADAMRRLRLDDGSQLEAEIVVWATSAAPAPLLDNVPLPKDQDGFLSVRSTLQSTGDDAVFAVGDCASLVDYRLPKAGVYAVREGPVLWENLRRVLSHRPLRTFSPQRGFLSLLSIGDGRALLDYHGFSASGRWVWRLKNHIDRRFMRMYHDYPPRRTIGRPGSASLLDHMAQSSPPPMRCTGCGSKVGADVLASALKRLRSPENESGIQGLERPDDAIVLDRLAAPIDVLSVDYFPAFLDDPFLVGRIAALHALSDLWAMGAEPLGALALAALPAGSKSQQANLLHQLLAGGVRELTSAGAKLWGGHTIEGAELSIGFSVAGNLDGKAPFTKGGLRPGDRLILTKPLGTGGLLAALRACRCRANWIDRMLAQMLAGNAAAAGVAREFGVLAATDVTGFGLGGHLLEMIDASGVAVSLSLSSIPLMEGFAELASAGFRSSLDPSNRHCESRIRLRHDELSNQPGYHALFDPQTSGGLLIGVAQDRAEPLRAKLVEAGCSSASIVGFVPARSTRAFIEISR